MANQYFVYKTNHVTNIGGITPALPKTGHLGLALKRGWFLGVIDSSELDWFQSAKEFNINPCTELEAQGFMLLDVTQIYTSTPGMPNYTVRELTAEELQLQQLGEAFIAKLKLRPRVAAFVGDQDDQMSDLAKRVALLERCLFMLYAVLQSTSPMPEPWHTLLTTAHADFVAGTLKDPVDIRPDGYMSVYNILKERGNTLTAELATYYAAAMPSEE